MKTPTTILAVAVSMVSVALAQQPPFDRLPMDELDMVPPSARVTGTLGDLDIGERSCQSRHLTDESLRRRIVDVAAQEWGFFGFTVLDYTRAESFNWRARGSRRRWSLLQPARYRAGGPHDCRLLDRDTGGCVDHREPEPAMEPLGCRDSLANALVGGLRLLGDVRERIKRASSVPTCRGAP